MSDIISAQFQYSLFLYKVRASLIILKYNTFIFLVNRLVQTHLLYAAIYSLFQDYRSLNTYALVIFLLLVM